MRLGYIWVQSALLSSMADEHKTDDADSMTPQFAALTCLEGYRNRLIASLTWLEGAAYARIRLPTQLPALEDTIEGCMSYLLEGEADFKKVQSILASHAALWAEVQLMEEEVRKERAVSEQLFTTLLHKSMTADAIIATTATKIAALQQAGPPLPLTTLLNGAERFSFTLAGPSPLLPSPFPSPQDIQSSLMLRMQVDAATAAACKVGSGTPNEAPGTGGDGWIDLSSWFRTNTVDTSLPGVPIADKSSASAVPSIPEDVPETAAPLTETIMVAPNSIHSSAQESNQSMPVSTATQPEPRAVQVYPEASALPPQLLDIISRFMPTGWKPGDPMPSNLPDLSVLMASMPYNTG
jgi:hypothetical protein